MSFWRKKRAVVEEVIPPLIERLMAHQRNASLSGMVVDERSLEADLMETIQVLSIMGESEDRAIHCIREIQTIMNRDSLRRHPKPETRTSMNQRREITELREREFAAALNDISTVVRLAVRLHDDVEDDL